MHLKLKISGISQKKKSISDKNLRTYKNATNPLLTTENC